MITEKQQIELIESFLEGDMECRENTNKLISAVWWHQASKICNPDSLMFSDFLSKFMGGGIFLPPEKIIDIKARIVKQRPELARA